jgi:hypothetical protein
MCSRTLVCLRFDDDRTCAATRLPWWNTSTVRAVIRAKCHTKQTNDWLEARKAEMLPTDYFHVTITVPQELRELLRANQRDGYALLMKAAADAIIELAHDRRFVGGTVERAG